MDEHNCCLFSSAMWKDAATSVLVSRTLDHIGYSLSMVRLRQDIYKQPLKNKPNEKNTIIFSGSKAEGLSKTFESDVDLLVTVSELICTTSHRNFIRSNQHTIFQMDIVDTSPGYARLLHDGPVNEDVMGSIMYSICELSYLPSDKWRILNKHAHSKDSSTVKSSEEFSGPSCPMIYYEKHYQISFDTVVGIFCDCPDIIRPWVDRQRIDFPSVDVIQDISSMEAHAVPVGYKESEWQFLEWRICFTKAEIRLVQSLNDCQIKMLILLRKIAKFFLKPICKEMSSYIMKNIVLWMSEQMHGNYFTEENLCQALETSLKLLRSCLIRKRLPSYMMAERNLLAGRVTECERSELCREIDSLFREGPRVILRWNHVSSALNRLYCSPDTYCNLSNLYILIELSSLFEGSPQGKRLKAAVKEALLSEYPELRIRFSKHLKHNLFKVFLS